MKDSETLWCVHDRLKQGWCKYALRNIYGDVCLVGAVSEVTGVYDLKQPVLQHLRQTLTGSHTSYGSVVQFNEHPHTVKQDVLDLVAKTAIRLEEQGL